MKVLRFGTFARNLPSASIPGKDKGDSPKDEDEAERRLLEDKSSLRTLVAVAKTIIWLLKA